MSNGVPRRLIDELISRWTIGGLKTTFVEGPNDQRLLRLLQREMHCPHGLLELDPCPIDAIEIPHELLQQHGLDGSGAKQRVVAISREILERGVGGGFRGVVDIDLDQVFGIDLRSEAVIYTDHSCMDLYLWNVRVLNRMLIQFRCDGSVVGVEAEKSLFESIALVCSELAIARVINQTHREWKLEFHHSEKSLTIRNAVLAIDIDAYVAQCKPPKSAVKSLKELIASTRRDLSRLPPFELINGHDLVWLLTYCLRELTTMQRRQVEEETVRNSLLAFGISNAELGREALFLQLAEWQTADT